MKNLLQILFLLLVGLNFISAQDCKSNLVLKAESEDLLIFIDNEYLGNGNVETSLSEGLHKIKIKEPGLRWDARTLEKEINITECGKEYNFTFKFDEEYLLETNPSNVWVYSNDTLVGNTPILISKNIETIKLEKEDYKTRILNVNQLSSTDKIHLDFTGELKTKRFIETPFFELLVGTAVGLGALAAYYKIQADQSFDKYEETKEQRYLDDTDKYDNISGIAFGALQLNFGALIYFLLSDQ